MRETAPDARARAATPRKEGGEGEEEKDHHRVSLLSAIPRSERAQRRQRITNQPPKKGKTKHKPTNVTKGLKSSILWCNYWCM